MVKYRSKRIYTEDRAVDGFMAVKEGKIVHIGVGNTEDAVDLGENYIIPGIIDTHNHASLGYSPSGSTHEERTANTKRYLKALSSLGVTGVFPTLFSTEADRTSLDEMKSLETMVKTNVDGAKVLGINFEGPFLNRVGEKGTRYDAMPIDLDYAKKCVELGNGKLKVMGLAPELPGAGALIEYLQKNDVVAAFAHSDCTSSEAFAAFDLGVSVAAHTCNVMVGIHHRDVGGLGAALLDERVRCELICDGVHVCNDMLKLIIRAKGMDKIMLISDSSRFVGAPQGKYVTNTGTYIIDDKGRVLDENGSLNGSSRPVLFGIKNLVENVGVDMLDALNMASLNPARKYRLDGTKGSLEVGKDADFAVISPDLQVCETYVEGVKVYDSKIDSNLFNENLRRIEEE